MSSEDDRDVMISVRGLGKAYTIAQSNQRATTLAEAAVARLRRPLHRPDTETFWALRDVSFDVRRGDVVGVIGRNGAGKSTLFKVLSRITEPTIGEVDLYGRVGSLLEVGTGFSGELTGRENIYLNGTILGMRRSEIDKRFDEIVDFSGIEKFLDTPVKRYSSGMYVRLAFAVAAHLETEILILDEVLSVGDADFQRKCLNKVRDVALDGRTILLVSHHMSTITSICNRALLLAGGQVQTVGEVRSVADEYRRLAVSSAGSTLAGRADRKGSGRARLVEFSIAESGENGVQARPTIGRTQSVSVGAPARFTARADRPIANGSLWLCIYDLANNPVFMANSQNRSLMDRVSGDALTYTCVCDRLFLQPGEYTVSVSLTCHHEVVDELQAAAVLVVEPGLLSGRTVSGGGIAALPHTFELPGLSTSIVAGVE